MWRRGRSASPSLAEKLSLWLNLRRNLSGCISIFGYEMWLTQLSLRLFNARHAADLRASSGQK